MKKNQFKPAAFLFGKKKSVLLFAAILAAVFVIFSSCKKSAFAKSKEQAFLESDAENQIAEFNLYNPALDDATWVEQLISNLEEERIALELSQMEESRFDYQLTENQNDLENTEAEADLTEVEKFFSEIKNGQVFSGKKGELDFFEFENEIFLPQKIDGKLVLVHSLGNDVFRYFYDEQFRLSKQESWNIPSALASELEKTELFEYYSDSNILQKKITKSKNLVEEISYNENGFATDILRFVILDQKNQILSKRHFVYNDENKLLSDELTENFFKDSEYLEFDYSFVKKYVYSYTNSDVPPDFKYYENGIVKMWNKYSSVKGTYTSQIYFDEKLSVKTYYENDLRKKDVFYNGKKILREKLYENDNQEIHRDVQ